MTILIQLFEIILLQRRPKDLKYDEFAAVFCIVFWIGLNYVVHIASGAYSSPFGYALVLTVAMLVVLYAILSASKKQNRFVQTVTASFGTQSLLGAASIALTSVTILHILIPLLSLWLMYIGILIMKEALEISWIRALLVSIGIQLMSVVVLILVYPEFIAEWQQATGVTLPSKPV